MTTSARLNGQVTRTGLQLAQCGSRLRERQRPRGAHSCAAAAAAAAAVADADESYIRSISTSQPEPEPLRPPISSRHFLASASAEEPARRSQQSDIPDVQPAIYNTPTTNRPCTNSSKWLLSTFFTPTVPVVITLGISRGLASSAESTANNVPMTLPEIEGFDPGSENPAAIRKQNKAKSRIHQSKQWGLSQPKVAPQKAQEMLEMLDTTDVASTDEYFNFNQDTYLRRYAQPDGPKVHYTERPWDYHYPSYEDTVGRNSGTRVIYLDLISMIRMRQRGGRVTGNGPSLSAIHQIYQRLPEPRMLYIPSTMRHKLLRIFGMPEKRDTPAMLRYYALINDVKDSGLALSRHEWNYCMAFSKRCVYNASETWLLSALKTWKAMEDQGMVTANEVTFNMLFDAASKCGNFELAQMIYQEMRARHIRANRYHHVSLIHYFGLKQDADGVRAAYRDMVLAGELIDTVVLNCVIVGFLNSLEEPSADYVYQQMKRRSLGPEAQSREPHPDYRDRSVITKVLMMWSRVVKRHPELRLQLQQASQIAPDVRTLRIFIQHYAVRVGDMSRVAAYLDEMCQLGLPMDGRIFVTLFEAFAKHGSGYSTNFTRERLSRIFQALMSALENEVKDVYVDSWMMIWCLRAFKRCGSESEVLKAYDELGKWLQVGNTRRLYLYQFLRLVVEGRDPFARYDIMGSVKKEYSTQWTGPFGRRASSGLN